MCCVADGLTQISGRTLSTDVRCCVCDGDAKAAAILHHHPKDQALAIFSNLIQFPTFLKSRRPRVTAMLALRRFLLHNDGLLDLEQSAPGKWCLQSLNSSVRELRIAAGRALAAFMPKSSRESPPEELSSRNRVYAIAALKTVSDDDKPHLIETRIMAWGQLGKTVAEDGLNLILIKLLEYLGSSNNIVSAFAFNELLNLAESRSSTPRRLFEPFWKSLAYMATNEMVQRPQRSRAVAELLQISVNELLLLIQTHALPWLVLDKRLDVIQKIAEARQDEELWQPLLDSTNLAATLALLLVQDPENMQEFTKSRLNDISPHFHPLKLLDLFRSEPVLIAIELLKSAACADAPRRHAVCSPLHSPERMLTVNRRTRHCISWPQ